MSFLFIGKRACIKMSHVLRLKDNSWSCSPCWVVPAIFTFQKTSPHSCSEAAVTLGPLSLCSLQHATQEWEKEACVEAGLQLVSYGVDRARLNWSDCLNMSSYVTFSKRLARGELCCDRCGEVWIVAEVKVLGRWRWWIFKHSRQ